MLCSWLCNILLCKYAHHRREIYYANQYAWLLLPRHSMLASKQVIAYYVITVIPPIFSKPGCWKTMNGAQAAHILPSLLT